MTASPCPDPQADPAAVQQALAWMVTLWSGETTAEERSAWERWRTAHPEHERAWQQVLQMEQRLQRVPATVARTALARAPVMSRRKALQALGLAVAAGGLGYANRDAVAWSPWLAEHRTGVGEWLALTLSDGTRVQLNTASAIDVRFDRRHRRILLRAGEILVDTAHDPAHRPFSVETAQGAVRALGTRFSVRQADALARVAVFEGAVEIRPQSEPEPLQVAAGRGVDFSRDHVELPVVADPNAVAWASRTLVAERMRLADFLVELGRYRRGVIRCHEAVADLIVSGVFPLGDTDRVLETVGRALPVRIDYTTRYWVAVAAR